MPWTNRLVVFVKGQQSTARLQRKRTDDVERVRCFLVKPDFTRIYSQMPHEIIGFNPISTSASDGSPHCLHIWSWWRQRTWRYFYLCMRTNQFVGGAMLRSMQFRFCTCSFGVWSPIMRRHCNSIQLSNGMAVLLLLMLLFLTFFRYRVSSTTIDVTVTFCKQGSQKKTDVFPIRLLLQRGRLSNGASLCN